MTGRERCVAASRGGELDRAPVILLTGTSASADAVVVELSDVERALAESPDQAVLVRVDGLHARVESSTVPLFDLIANDPEAADAKLEEISLETSLACANALGSGADGVLYLLTGAHPAATSPMQYGSFFLERDRSILEAITDARFNVVLVEADTEPYLDFLTDLPCHVLAWTATEDVNLSDLRAMKGGALGTPRPGGDVLIAQTPESISSLLAGALSS